MGGLLSALETARALSCQFFTPSSIAAFGADTPKTQRRKIQLRRPLTMYGVSKVSGELLCDYYYHKYGVDTRGLRFPGLISHSRASGRERRIMRLRCMWPLSRGQANTSFIDKGTYLDMMYMPDAISAIIALMEADPAKLKHRNAFNVTAMSVDPEGIAASIRRHIPDFSLDYDVDRSVKR